MKLPSDDDLRKLGPQILSNEIEVQRFIEDHVLEQCGLDRVCSSVSGRGRVGFIDTIALDDGMNLVIIEYKWDMVDRHTLAQVARYRDWLLKNPKELPKFGIASKRKHLIPAEIRWRGLRAITIGHRYDPSVLNAHKDLNVTFVRYGRWDDRTVYLREVTPRELGDGIVGHRAPRESKDHYLEKHLKKTTLAASDAFALLQRRMADLHFVEEIQGKKVGYKKDSHSVAVMVSPIGLEVSFTRTREVDDDEGRALVTGRSAGRLACGIATEADVDPVVELLKTSLGVGDDAGSG